MLFININWNLKNIYIYIPFFLLPLSGQYFWVGGMREDLSWMWIDGTDLQLGAPFWGQVSELYS